ncbi:MAG: hypothetical protein ABSC08_17905 [Bryobacteraceae bacterium]
MGPLFFAVAALALIAFLQFSLFIATRRRLELLITSQNSRFNDWHAKEERLIAEISQLKDEVAGLRPSRGTTPLPGQSMNLSRRNQVLRLHFRGDSPSRIASALQISKGEVDLLLKVHRTLVPSTGWTTLGTQAPRKALGIAPDSTRPTDEGESPQAAAIAPTAFDASPASQVAAE